MIATFQKILTHKKKKIKQTQSHMDLMPNQVKAVQFIKLEQSEEFRKFN